MLLSNSPSSKARILVTFDAFIMKLKGGRKKKAKENKHFGKHNPVW